MAFPLMASFLFFIRPWWCHGLVVSGTVREYEDHVVETKEKMHRCYNVLFAEVEGTCGDQVLHTDKPGHSCLTTMP